MLFEYFIPTAHAAVSNTIKNTAVAGKDVAVEHGEVGIQEFFSFIGRNIDNWIAGLIIVVVFYLLAKMASKAAKEAIIKSKGDEIQESVLVLVGRITRITILGIGITIALAINGLNFTTVIGALSLGIGFALKDIIGNFISGVIMLSQDRVRIGDLIKIGDILGTIVNIDTRATILQALDGTEVVIPNQKMLSETLISYSSNPFRRIELVVGVDYNTDLPMVTSLVKGIMKKDKNIVPRPSSVVLVDEFGDSSINIKIRFWVESGDNWLDVRSNLANKIKKAFDDVGVNIPFPIRTLKLDENDRAFLKTMDSMKKGYVPEQTAVPNKDQIKSVATKVSQEQNIPYEVFEQSQSTPKSTPQPATTKPTSPATPPQSINEAADKQPVAVGAAEGVGGDEVPPPTHM